MRSTRLHCAYGLMAAACCLAGCVFEPNSAGPTDLGPLEGPDAAAADARGDDAADDAGTENDSGAIDVGTLDGGALDAELDGGTPDAMPDAGDDAGEDAGEPDTGTPDAGTPDTGTPDAGTPDTGPVDTGVDGGFPYAPSNTTAPGAAPLAWNLNSGTVSDFCQLSTTNGTFTGAGCGNPRPQPEFRYIEGTLSPVLVLSVSALNVSRAFNVVGPTPLIILVYGDAQIAQSIDVGANNVAAGPGANGLDCVQVVMPPDGSATLEGGGGGGFGQAGATGGVRTTRVGGFGIAANGTVELVPLRGGCSGGNGNPVQGGGTPHGHGGGGGGALQISTSGSLTLSSQGGIFASGGGGEGGRNDGGGGGGGSGGAILLEAFAFSLDAPLYAGGGGGGGGGDNDPVNTAGEDGNIVTGAVALGSDGDPNDGGDGGEGGIAPRNSPTVPNIGEDPGGNAGGGGGGGGAGRIRINIYGSSCMLTRRIWTGVLSSRAGPCSF